MHGRTVTIQRGGCCLGGSQASGRRGHGSTKAPQHLLFLSEKQRAKEKEREIKREKERKRKRERDKERVCVCEREDVSRCVRGSSGVERMNGRAQSPLPCLIVARDDKKAGCNNLSFHVFATTQVSGVLPIALLAAICTLCSPNGDFNLFECVLLATQTKSKSTLQQRREKRRARQKKRKRKVRQQTKPLALAASSPLLSCTTPYQPCLQR